MMAFEDDIAAAVGAQADQTKAGMAQFAKFVFGYYRSLREAGFTRAQALNLAAQYQAAMLTVAVNRKGQSA